MRHAAVAAQEVSGSCSFGPRCSWWCIQSMQPAPGGAAPFPQPSCVPCSPSPAHVSHDPKSPFLCAATPMRSSGPEVALHGRSFRTGPTCQPQQGAWQGRRWPWACHSHLVQGAGWVLMSDRFYASFIGHACVVVASDPKQHAATSIPWLQFSLNAVSHVLNLCCCGLACTHM